jgi:hypothetical protein
MKQHYAGGCHCGGVRYEVEADLSRTVSCNCSICAKSGTILTFVPAADFRLVEGGNLLTDYQFNRRVIHHLFCKVCGVRSFSRGEKADGSQSYAVNVRTLDDVDMAALQPKPFDGKSL